MLSTKRAVVAHFKLNFRYSPKLCDFWFLLLISTLKSWAKGYNCSKPKKIKSQHFIQFCHLIISNYGGF